MPDWFDAAARRMADALGADVLVVEGVPSELHREPRLPYLVLAAVADARERRAGRRFRPGEKGESEHG